MWLYIPREYCPSSPESLDSISEFGLFFQNLELSVSLSGKATQRPYSWRGWKTRPWMKLLSGVTLQPSTAASGMELWIQSLLASPAKISQSQASARESRKGQGQGCSLKPAELFAKYDQGIFLSKTSQDSFLTSSCQSYSENFPKWGSMHSGECFRQEMWEAPILEKESSSWRTPRATEYKNPDQSHAQKAKGLPVEHLSAQTKTWGTPTVDAISDRKNKYAQGGTPIAMQASSWPTPKAVEIEENVEHWEIRRKKPGNKMMGPSLHVKTQQFSRESSSWPTPASRDHKGATITDRYPNGFNKNLASDVASWPTPTATMVKGPYSEEAQTRKDGKSRTMDRLDNAVMYVGPSAKNWPTPSANEDAAGTLNGKMQRMLTHASKEFSSWPTPSATEVRQGNQHRKNKDAKGTQQSLTTIVLKEFECNNPTGPSAPVKQNNGSDSSKSAPISPQPLKKRLNPKFVEHLMGMPPGWSLPIPIDQNVFKRWETESARLLRLLHSRSYGNE